MKDILGVLDAPPQHWVGDGFPVRSLFSYNSHAKALSPFLLLDYAGPMEFSPAAKPRGVGSHPHRGFETVTIVYDGEVAHRDSTGAGGTIGPGDVQWMTAASGILHDEFHSDAFSKSGGTLEMVQLWVNLPARDKMSAPKYQTLKKSDIPVVALPGDAGTVRVISGIFDGYDGPAQTFTPVQLWDARLRANHRWTFAPHAGHNLALVILHGTVEVNGEQKASDAQLVLVDPHAKSVVITAQTAASVLVLSGEPIEEPLVGYGPFVMNSETEIRQAIDDFNRGQFGAIPAEATNAPAGPGTAS